MSIFKRNNDLEFRKKESKRLLDIYKNRIPVICEKSPYEKHLPVIEKIKYLIPSDCKENQLIFIIKRNLNLNVNNPLFLIAKNDKEYSLSGNRTMSEIYQDYKDPEDGFLYIFYASEDLLG